jgi:hypothetical protein
MHVRNWLVHPPFIMFYLTFLVPDAKRLLVERGFAVEVRERIFAPPFQSACLVLATRLPEAEGPPRSTADRERQRFSDTL